MIDVICHRNDLKEQLTKLLGYFCGRGGRKFKAA